MFGIERADVEMVEIIHSSGLTVDQAISLRKQGALPESIENVWNRYDERVADGRLDVGLMMVVIKKPPKGGARESVVSV